ncbi:MULTISPECIES: beta-class phenol-soluble modulin [Staphylococcus]|nr:MULTISPECIES: beta-class phenol-soluble modulin [Staphylococcus]
MSKLVQAISDAVQAGQNQDWTKLGTSILDIVSNGVTELSKIFGF